MSNPPGLRVRWAGWLLVLCACTKHEPELERRGDPPPDPDSGTMTPPCDEGTGGEGGALPPIRFCQAEIVLRTVCQRCHADPPLNGAPFSLVTYEDTQEPFGSLGRYRWQRMKEAVESGFMPLRGLDLDPPIEPLTCEERSTLLGWLDQCALPEGGTECDDPSETLLTCDTM
jgi:hypothetical protein